MRTEGKAIAYNALVVTLGFLVLLGSNFRGLVNVGILTALTMGISALSAFTVIPALLALRKPAFLEQRALLQSSLGPNVPEPNPKGDYSR